MTAFPDGIESFFQKGIVTHTYPGDTIVRGVTATSVATALNGKVSTPNAKSGNIQSLPLTRWDILT
jgi:hypothetical protein